MFAVRAQWVFFKVWFVKAFEQRRNEMANEQQSESLLELVLQEPATVHRRQFQVGEEQETQLCQQFFPGHW